MHNAKQDGATQWLGVGSSQVPMQVSQHLSELPGSVVALIEVCHKCAAFSKTGRQASTKREHGLYFPATRPKIKWRTMTNSLQHEHLMLDSGNNYSTVTNNVGNAPELGQSD